MLYRIEIQGNTNGELFYDVSFQSGIDQFDIKKFNSDDIKDIHTTVEHLADALRNLSTLQPQGKIQQTNQAERLKNILSNIRLQLDFLHGLKVIDAPTPDAFVIDNSAYLSLTDEAFAILDSPDCNHNNGCP